MNRVLLLEPNAGISGDMMLGALVDAGASLDVMNQAVAKATLGKARLEGQDAFRCGFRCVHVRVLVDGVAVHEGGGPVASGEPAASEVPHAHHQHHHKWKDIDAQLAGAGLDPDVSDHARAVFLRLAEAEARVHGHKNPEAVHFHEVGSTDAVADIVGSVAGLVSLQARTRWHTPPRVGGGAVEADHGRLSVPAPATLELLQGIRVISGGNEGELVTPTGAALLSLFQPLPVGADWTPGQTGYGAGTKDPDGFPNLLRLTVGTSGNSSTEMIDVVEASLDDCTPEDVGYWIQLFLDRGALDASVTPIMMKKGRPGFVLQVLGKAGSGPDWAGMMTRESTSLGARWRTETRRVLPRRIDVVKLGGESIRVKVAELDSGDRPHAEFEDLVLLANKTNRSLIELRREVERLWHQTHQPLS